MDLHEVTYFAVSSLRGASKVGFQTTLEGDRLTPHNVHFRCSPPPAPQVLTYTVSGKIFLPLSWSDV